MILFDKDLRRGQHSKLRFAVSSLIERVDAGTESFGVRRLEKKLQHDRIYCCRLKRRIFSAVKIVYDLQLLTSHFVNSFLFSLKQANFLLNYLNILFIY